MRRALAFTTVATFLVALYTAWTLYSRHEEVKDAERRAQQQTGLREAALDQMAAKILDGGLKIVAFAADQGVVEPGGRVLLCYGVANAARVRIDPPVKTLKPALNSCFEVFPSKTTVYRLTAEDAQGHTAEASLTIIVNH